MPAVTAIEVRYADIPCHYRVAPTGGKQANQGQEGQPGKAHLEAPWPAPRSGLPAMSARVSSPGRASLTVPGRVLGCLHLADGLLEPVRGEDDQQQSVDGGQHLGLAEVDVAGVAARAGQGVFPGVAAPIVGSLVAVLALHPAPAVPAVQPVGTENCVMAFVLQRRGATVVGAQAAGEAHRRSRGRPHGAIWPIPWRRSCRPTAVPQSSRRRSERMTPFWHPTGRGVGNEDVHPAVPLADRISQGLD